MGAHAFTGPSGRQPSAVLAPRCGSVDGDVAGAFVGRRRMAGMFELFNDEESGFRFRITAPDGTVMAVSRSFPDKPSAVAGIKAVREYAGMGHIADLCRKLPGTPTFS
jgi:uncharacterized protein YegP (UPF0339 family)